MNNQLAKLPRINDIRICLIGFGGCTYDVAAALRAVGLPIACVVTHLRDNASDPVAETLRVHGMARPMAEVAKRAEAPLIYVPDPNTSDAIQHIRASGANLALSWSAPVLRASFLSAFEGLVLNFHGSKRYRGRGGATWLILNGASDDAIVLHWVTSGIDRGDAIDEQPFEIPAAAYPLDIMLAQQRCVHPLVERLRNYLDSGSLPRHPQPMRPYFPGLNTAIDGVVDWSWPTGQILSCIRGFGTPYAGPAAVLESSGRQNTMAVRLARAQRSVKIGNAYHPVACGVVLDRIPDGAVTVAVRDGAILVTSLRDNGKEVPAAQIIKLGSRFLSPNHLLKART